MAIVLKYSAPGSIMQAGFAAGVGSRKQKEQKDLLDVWQQQTQQNFAGQQAGFNRLLQVGLQQNQQDFAAGQNKFNLDFRAAQNQQDRFFQAGQAELGRDFQAGQADKLMEARNRADERRFAEETFFRLPPIPEHVDPTVRKDLAGKRNAMGALLGKGWDRSDPATQKAWGEAYDAYTTGVAAIPPPDRAAETNKNTIYRDQSGKAFNEPGTGRTAFDSQTGRAIENPQAEALAQQQAAQQKQQQQQAEQFQKEQKEYSKLHQAEMQRLQSASEELDAEGNPTGKLKPLNSFAEEATKNLGLSKIFEPQAPPQPPAAQQAPSPQQGPNPQAQPNGGDDLDKIIQEDIDQRKAQQAQYDPFQEQNQIARGQMTAQQQLESVKSQGYTEKQALAYLDKVRGMNPAAASAQPNWSGFGGGSVEKSGGASGSWGSPEQNAAAPQQGTNQSQYTPEMRKSILEGSQLPKPQSEEELKAHPEWPSFVAPDGTIRKNPYAR